MGQTIWTSKEVVSALQHAAQLPEAKDIKHPKYKAYAKVIFSMDGHDLFPKNVASIQSGLIDHFEALVKQDCFPPKFKVQQAKPRSKRGPKL